MAWRKLGLIWGPDGRLPWARSHASQPFAVALEASLFRIFFSSRDAGNRSSIGYVDLSLDGEPQIVAEATEPVMAPGVPGRFDQAGLGMGCVIPGPAGEQADRLYYMGWDLSGPNPWRNSIGLAIGCVRTGVFRRHGAGAVIAPDCREMLSLSYPFIVQHGAGSWEAWFGAHRIWGAAPGDFEHDLRSAASQDGLQWQTDDAPLIPLDLPEEFAQSRPSLEIHGDRCTMWYASRGDHYRILCAGRSDANPRWERLGPENELSPSSDGWDSEMVCYPHVFCHGAERYMLYNGNAYGEAGFGVAIWDET